MSKDKKHPVYDFLLDMPVFDDEIEADLELANQGYPTHGARIVLHLLKQLHEGRVVPDKLAAYINEAFVTFLKGRDPYRAFKLTRTRRGRPTRSPYPYVKAYINYCYLIEGGVVEANALEWCSKYANVTSEHLKRVFENPQDIEKCIEGLEKTEYSPPHNDSLIRWSRSLLIDSESASLV